MNIQVIKQLAETVELDILAQCEEALLEDEPLPMDIQGQDAAERLTNVMAAIWIKKDMQKSGSDLRTALRNYTQKVRKSIS
jgi:hypothetical protein